MTTAGVASLADLGAAELGRRLRRSRTAAVRGCRDRSPREGNRARIAVGMRCIVAVNSLRCLALFTVGASLSHSRKRPSRRPPTSGSWRSSRASCRPCGERWVSTPRGEVVEASNTALLEATDSLRKIIEAVHGHRITPKGEGEPRPESWPPARSRVRSREGDQRLDVPGAHQIAVLVVVVAAVGVRLLRTEPWRPCLPRTGGIWSISGIS